MRWRLTVHAAMDAVLPPLTAAELREFCENGFIVKRGALSPAGCASARDAYWASNRSAKVQRHDRSSWLGGFAEEDSSFLPENGGRLNQSGRMWVYREPMGDPLLLDLVPRRVMPWLEQLLGKGQVQQPIDGATEDPLRGSGQSGGKVVRGIYGNMPSSPDEAVVPVAEQHGHHVDPQPCHVIVTAHLDDLPAQGGGTLLWPGSHRLLHRQNPVFANLMQATQFKEWSEEEKTWEGHPYVHCRWQERYREDYAVVADWVGKNITPVEFSGGEGDVLIWHSRCFHAGSRNFSGSVGEGTQPQIRQAVFYDCHKADMLTRDEADLPDDMWHDWSEDVRAAAAGTHTRSPRRNFLISRDVEGFACGCSAWAAACIGPGGEHGGDE